MSQTAPLSVDPIRRWDEVPIAYVIRRPGVLFDAEALMAHAGSQLARFKVPREIFSRKNCHERRWARSSISR